MSFKNFKIDVIETNASYRYALRYKSTIVAQMTNKTIALRIANFLNWYESNNQQFNDDFEAILFRFNWTVGLIEKTKTVHFMYGNEI